MGDIEHLVLSKSETVGVGLNKTSSETVDPVILREHSIRTPLVDFYPRQWLEGTVGFVYQY